MKALGISIPGVVQQDYEQREEDSSPSYNPVNQIYRDPLQEMLKRVNRQLEETRRAERLHQQMFEHANKYINRTYGLQEDSLIQPLDDDSFPSYKPDSPPIEDINYISMHRTNQRVMEKRLELVTGYKISGGKPLDPHAPPWVWQMASLSRR